jgi:hypothetical protein
MQGFAAWLHDLADNDPNLAALKTFAADHTTTWPYWSDKAADYRNAIVAVNPPPANRDELLSGLATYFERWSALDRAQPAAAKASISVGEIGLVIFGLVFAFIIGYAVFNDRFYESLGHIEQVRGLVTYFFAFSTTAVIALVALGIFWLKNDEAVKTRFEAAKDLLTLVIGVLGTIMGFYFGTATGGTANLSIGGVSLVPPVVHAGQSVTLNGRVNGGTKPYKYTVMFTDPSGALTSKQLSDMDVDDGSSDDGAIARQIPVPSIKGPAEVFFTLTASDSKNITTLSSGALYIEPPKAPPAASNASPPPAAK